MELPQRDLSEPNGINSVLRVERPPFVPFAEDRVTRVYQRNLPHWRQEGATYFVTFRLADSIPGPVRREMEYEQAAWLKARGIRYDGPRGRWRTALDRLPLDAQAAFEKFFNRQYQACLDRGLGACRLRESECVEVVRDEFLADDGSRQHLGDFMIMPNHVHVLVTPVLGVELEAALKRVKGASATLCNRVLRQSGAFWQAESYDHIVRSLEQLQQYRQYIADNPTRAGIAVSARSYYVAAWMDDWFKA